ncbi:tRNA (adenosine(37)-N6)-threonylcarbamoyltransferase complex ATPase subunit type 1 TsaE [candidate division GN15 bacterium]|uniref:tRNA threonylcarbamoyladenosine biosynthesis protein TsaE n=1 Tax=candidate division GN15 bacterium TaxID=2072418 RepID=A0A855WVA4_9BACT|nr:MAG: tRNA (adenosine(37)-N6)-threonylcarbamoyltransferase complex ATPase subunit type 1 TsaE [candidate division GN15 bacterium]
MKALSIISHSEAETFALARRLSSSFADGEVVVLTGPLGAGKTVFVRGLAAGRKIAEAAVSSPSFGFVNEYPGTSPVYHFDLYRLNNLNELSEIGWDDYLQRPGLIVIEWGEKAAEYLPSRYYLVQIAMVDEEQREIEISLVQE